MAKLHARQLRKKSNATRNRRILLGILTVWALATIISTRGHFAEIPSAALDILFTWGFALACVVLLLMGLASVFSLVPLKIFGLSEEESDAPPPQRSKPRTRSHLRLVEPRPASPPETLQ